MLNHAKPVSTDLGPLFQRKRHELHTTSFRQQITQVYARSSQHDIQLNKQHRSTSAKQCKFRTPNAHDTLFRSVNHWGVIRPVWSSPKIFRGHHQLCSTSPGTFPYIITYDTYVAHVPGRSWHQNFLASAPLAPPSLSSPTCLGILDASPGSQGSQGSDMGGIPMGRWFSSWKILWKWMITGGIPISGTPIRWFP